MTTKPKYTATSVTPITKTPDPHRRVRKIGQRDETISVDLSYTELEEGRRRILDLLSQEDQLDEALAEVKSQHKARRATLRAERAMLRRQDAAKKRSVDVIIEEWLTQSNEVIKIRTDTGEQIGARTASATELQEPLFPADREGDVKQDEEDDLDKDEEFGGASH